MTEWEPFVDEYGEGVTNGVVKRYTSHSQKWYEENPIIELEPQLPTLEEKLATLEQEKLVLQLALAESIEKQEMDKISNQLALAELIETLTIKGVL